MVIKEQFSERNTSANNDIDSKALQRNGGSTMRTAAVILVSLLASFHAYKGFGELACWWNKSCCHSEVVKDVCPQAKALVPQANVDVWRALSDHYSTETFFESAVDWLGGAVRIPTQTFDDMGDVGEDPRWNNFSTFHNYLYEKFPLVHSELRVSKVNKYGLVYHWKGTNKTMKPLLLTAHQDVVPIDEHTVELWEHDPFGGYFDGEVLWGRGSIDDKSGLIGILISVEKLLEKGFKPKRPVVLSFGFDEEVSGTRGARKLAEYLLKTYGEFSMLVDEGVGFLEKLGTFIAAPGVTEKGYLSVHMEVTSPGGHSSIPPAHTSIGILSALLVQYEDNPFPVELDRTSPIYGAVQCLAAHAPDLDDTARMIIQRSASSDENLHLLESFISKDNRLRSLVSTTQAIDLVKGGVKVNALPENAWALINHRIATHSSVDEVEVRDTILLRHLADKFNLSFHAFGKDIQKTDGPTHGSLTLRDAFGTALEPAPVTPTDEKAVAYQVLSGTIKSTFKEFRRGGGEFRDIVVIPGIMPANTDTKHYWKLTKNIFRYNHINMVMGSRNPGVHTVNEGMPIRSFVEEVLFFTTLILNADEAEYL